MTSTLLDLSAKIDSLTVSILSQIQKVDSKERVPFFVVGAAARDILLEGAHGIRSKRATVDIDIAVFLENWTRFNLFKEALTRFPDFEEDP